MRFRELLEAVEIRDAGGDHDVRLAGITYDSRLVRPGFLFVAVKGLKADGHDYVPQAVDKGAAAVVAERAVTLPPGLAWALVPDSRRALALLSARFFGAPSTRLQLIGVTGTNGKTTTTSLIAAILEASGRKVGLLGTIQNKIGARVAPVSHTTPESTDLQALLSEMVEEGVDACVMEVSSHALALHRVDGCEFDLAVFTNLTRDHLDFHPDMDAYLAAKLQLFRSLQTPGQKMGVKYAIINADDPAAKQVMAAARGTVCTYGVKRRADIYATEIEISDRGASFTVNGIWGAYPLNLKLTGLFNVYNVLAAFAAAAALGVPPDAIKDALEQVRGVPGRFEPVEAGQDFTVIVDYAHTPDGLENILVTARQFTRGRLITVYGCGGDRDREKRPMMGAIAAKYSDLQFITSDNPRTEDPARIIEDIMAGVRPLVSGDCCHVEQDRRRAINLAVRAARRGDVVVIAGKGHEDYQIIGAEKLPFDDRREVLLAIEALRTKEEA